MAPSSVRTFTAPFIRYSSRLLLEVLTACSLFMQHFFTVRLNTSVDGITNAVEEINVKGPDDSDFNPYKSAFYATSTTFKSEMEAQRDINPFTSRYWKIYNPNTHNASGQHCAFKILPGGNALPFGRHDSKVVKRAGFIKHTLWVTPFNPAEKYPAGNYAVQKEIEDGLTKWTQANRNIYNTDIVVWYTVGVTHVVRNEDWPIMPVEYRFRFFIHSFIPV
jgi:primary-amine oxidase